MIGVINPFIASRGPSFIHWACFTWSRTLDVQLYILYLYTGKLFLGLWFLLAVCVRYDHVMCTCHWFSSLRTKTWMYDVWWYSTMMVPQKYYELGCQWCNSHYGNYTWSYTIRTLILSRVVGWWHPANVSPLQLCNYDTFAIELSWII